MNQFLQTVGSSGLGFIVGIVAGFIVSMLIRKRELSKSAMDWVEQRSMMFLSLVLLGIAVNMMYSKLLPPEIGWYAIGGSLLPWIAAQRQNYQHQQNRCELDAQTQILKRMDPGPPVVPQAAPQPFAPGQPPYGGPGMPGGWGPISGGPVQPTAPANPYDSQGSFGGGFKAPQTHAPAAGGSPVPVVPESMKGWGGSIVGRSPFG